MEGRPSVGAPARLKQARAKKADQKSDSDPLLL